MSHTPPYDVVLRFFLGETAYQYLNFTSDVVAYVDSTHPPLEYTQISFIENRIWVYSIPCPSITPVNCTNTIKFKFVARNKRRRRAQQAAAARATSGGGESILLARAHSNIRI